jgi:flagellar basal-body rod modification protein FlgD
MTNLAIPSASSYAAATSTTANSGAAQASSSGSGSSATLSQADFLQLLTAQLQYHTPTSPADPTQLASEFAQISTVDGIDNLNTKVGDIQSGTVASQMGQAASLVGKQVAISGDTLTTNASGAAEGAFNLAGNASDVSVSVMNAGGQVVGTMDLGAMSAGQQSFNWTGGTANAQYTYQVSATSSSGAISAVPYSVYTVEGVNVSGTSPTLNVAGYATPLPISDVQTVLGGSSS